MPRLIELWLVLVAIVFLFPLFLCISFAVKLSSPGPIFYQSLRMGIGGKEFRLFKFRSMTYSRESSDKPITVQNDNRITSIGRILRRYKLDELPQLLNILKGEMSIVGPRPEDPYFLKYYSDKQKRLLNYRPGLTSPASIAFRNEESKIDAENWLQSYCIEIMPKKLELDLRYFENRTALSDIRLIGKTVAAIFCDS